MGLPTTPFLFALATVCALAALVYGSISPAWREAGGERARRLPPVGSKLFAAMLGAVLLLLRWPVIFNPENIGIDEGLWISGALTLFRDPVFWRGVDGDSAGPLVFYAVMPLEPLGLLNFAGLKIAATLLLGGAIWFSYAGLRALWGDALARLGVLPAACFFACETRLEFVSYSTEHVTLLLLAIGWAGIAGAVARAEAFSPWTPSWLGAGCALGAVPFAKLQGVPTAAFLLLVATAWAATRRTWSVRRRGAAIATLAGAAAVVPAGFALTLLAGLRWEDFWTPYFELNRARSAQAFAADPAAGFVAGEFVRASRLFQVLLFGAPFVAAVAVSWRAPVRVWAQWPVLMVIGLAGLSVVTALAPAYSFHHLHFLVLPLSLLAGGFVAVAWGDASATARPSERRRRGLLAVFLAVLVVAPIGIWARCGNAPWPAAPFSLAVELGPLAREILRRARPGDALTVWGTQHVLHAQTRLPQGTREANPRIPVVPPFLRAYYRERYLADLERSRSRFFVDQTSLQSADSVQRARWGHEADRAVSDYVARHYDYAGEFEGMRLYVRKDADG